MPSDEFRPVNPPAGFVVLLAHFDRIEADPHETVAGLRRRLETAAAQCREIAAAGDPPAAGRPGVPEPLASELALWLDDADGSPHGFDEPARFSHRAAALETLVRHLAALEAVVGGGYPLGRLLGGADDKPGGLLPP